MAAGLTQFASGSTLGRMLGGAVAAGLTQFTSVCAVIALLLELASWELLSPDLLLELPL